jgi:hypothetical protein
MNAYRRNGMTRPHAPLNQPEERADRRVIATHGDGLSAHRMMVPSFPGLDTFVRDGRRVHRRAARRHDEGALLQGFARLDPEARFIALIRVVREPKLERLRKLLGSFPVSGLGVVATIPAAGAIDTAGGSRNGQPSARGATRWPARTGCQPQ